MNNQQWHVQHECEDNVGAALRTIDVLNLLALHPLPPHLIREIAAGVSVQKRIIKREKARMPLRRREESGR